MNFLIKLCCLTLFTFMNFQVAAVTLEELKASYKRPKQIPYLDDNPYSKEKELLGKILFFDPRLSGSNWISCATCHNPALGWEDGLPKGIGDKMGRLGRHSPTILNLAWAPRLMWDGRKSTLEDQALGPIEADVEMNQNPEELVKELKGINGYAELFKAAFGSSGITKENIGKAIGVFERGIVSGEAPFDKWVNGDENAISKDAVAGFKLFNGKAKCMDCHSGWSFTDHSFHDIGVKDKDIGRGKFLKLTSQQHAFKTPGLRNITQRAPYMHNGSEKTLMDVISFYNRGGDVIRPSKSGSIMPLNLSKKEMKQLFSFMETLTSKDTPIEIPVLPHNY